MSADDTCVHGRPVDEDCDGTCEHGVRCGALCQACDRAYWDVLRRFCALRGDGDVELGRRRAIAVLSKDPDPQAGDGLRALLSGIAAVALIVTYAWINWPWRGAA